MIRQEQVQQKRGNVRENEGKGKKEKTFRETKDGEDERKKGI